MKNYILLVLLCSVSTISCYSHFNIDEVMKFYRQAVPELWEPKSPSDSCSISCIKGLLPQNDSQEFPDYNLTSIGYSANASFSYNLSTSTYRDSFCNGYNKIKQCLSGCKDDKIKTAAKDFFVPFDNMCSNQFEAAMKDVCILSALKNSSYREENCTFGNQSLLDSNSTSTGKQDVGEFCQMIQCKLDCQDRSLAEAKCNPDAVKLVRKIKEQFWQSFFNSLDQLGVLSKQKLPHACKQLANGSSVPMKTSLLFVLVAFLITKIMW